MRFQVFQEAMLANRRGYVIGLPACPLGELYAKLPPGIDLRLNSRVDEILWETINPDAGMHESFFARRAPPPGDVLRMRACRRETSRRRRGTPRPMPWCWRPTHHAVQRWASTPCAPKPCACAMNASRGSTSGNA